MKGQHWIDNADSYICPVCGFECHNPSVYEGAQCPRCGFQDEEEEKQICEIAQLLARDQNIDCCKPCVNYPIYKCCIFVRNAKSLLSSGYQKHSGGAECPTCHGTGEIGTTDWLTKGISEKQLAKEKQKAMEEYEDGIKNTGAIEALHEVKKAVYKLYEDTKRYSRYKCTSLIGQSMRGALLNVIDEINKLKKIYEG